MPYVKGSRLIEGRARDEMTRNLSSHEKEVVVTHDFTRPPPLWSDAVTVQ